MKYQQNRTIHFFKILCSLIGKKPSNGLNIQFLIIIKFIIQHLLMRNIWLNIFSLCIPGLANFAGSICKKYNVELAGMMQYVTNQLKAGKR